MSNPYPFLHHVVDTLTKARNQSRDVQQQPSKSVVKMALVKDFTHSEIVSPLHIELICFRFDCFYYFFTVLL